MPIPRAKNIKCKMMSHGVGFYQSAADQSSKVSFFAVSRSRTGTYRLPCSWFGALVTRCAEQRSCLIFFFVSLLMLFPTTRRR